MSSTALFLDKVYEQQTTLSNNLNALEAEFKDIQDGFDQLFYRLKKKQKEFKKLAMVADENCAEIYNHMEGEVSIAGDFNRPSDAQRSCL
jgi:23S rRNA A2030 N6-methylase RlmJ